MLSRNVMKTGVMIILTCLVLIISTFAAADDQEDLAKESQNPIGNIISLPFENNIDFGVGPEDAFVYSLNLKPVRLDLLEVRNAQYGRCRYWNICRSERCIYIISQCSRDEVDQRQRVDGHGWIAKCN